MLREKLRGRERERNRGQREAAREGGGAGRCGMREGGVGRERDLYI